MESTSISLNDIFPFKDVKSSIDPILNYDHKGKSGKVLIIDNGEYIFNLSNCMYHLHYVYSSDKYIGM